MCVSDHFAWSDKDGDLKECLIKLAPASWLRGLINAVPKVGVSNNSISYYIGNFVMAMFIDLLQRRQETYPTLCLMLVFLKHHTSVGFCCLNKNNMVLFEWMSMYEVNNMFVIVVGYCTIGHVLGKIWDSFKTPPSADLHYVSYVLKLLIMNACGYNYRLLMHMLINVHESMCSSLQ